MAALGLALGLALSLLTGPAAAEGCPGAAVTPSLPAATARFDQGRLWRLHPPGASSSAPSHLYGTMHVDDPRALAFSPAVREALAGSRSFMPELRMDRPSEARFREAMQLPAGQTLEALLGEADFEAAARRLQSAYGVPRSVSLQLKPWAAYVTLNLPARPMGEIVDMALIRLASQRRIPVRGLETVEQQIAALEAVPLGAQTVLLNTLVRRHAEAQVGITTLIDCYLSGNLAAVRSQEEAEFAQDPALRLAFEAFSAELLDKRNGHMLRSLLPQAQAGGVFVAVGALHLTGEQGLLARLERLGWRLERVE